MSDDQWSPADESPDQALAREFQLLEPEDQRLVMALVARLRGPVEVEYRPDVPFMDFEE